MQYGIMGPILLDVTFTVSQATALWKSAQFELAIARLAREVSVLDEMHLDSTLSRAAARAFKKQMLQASAFHRTSSPAATTAFGPRDLA